MGTLCDATVALIEPDRCLLHCDLTKGHGGKWHREGYVGRWLRDGSQIYWYTAATNKFDELIEPVPAKVVD